jgi:hypothetical protein
VLRLADTAINKHGVLIWYPSLSQAVLNHIIRAIYVGKADVETRQPSTVALAQLLSASQECKRRIGFSDPAILAAALAALDQTERDTLLRRLDGVRLFHYDQKIEAGINVFPKHLADWRSPTGPLAHIQPSTWAALLGSAHAGNTQA